VRILIADDNAVMRAVLRTILRDEGFDVVAEAADGAAAIQMAKRLKPDIVCLDIVMPKSDGLQALQEIRTELPETLVLMISGNADRESVEAAISGGAFGYILKPFNSARVIETMKKAAVRVGASRQ
jgi:two-component system, chemotaxis family, chemotaxis protein CheY